MGNKVHIAISAALTAIMFLFNIIPWSSAWEAGDEADVFGHTFEEDSWYTTVTNRTKENDTAEFGVSYLNIGGDIQAFLIALNKVESDDGEIGVLPYQMFGMHYFTQSGQEMFIGALLAFLNVWEDKDNNSVPEFK
jgi:hypothetical protein